MAIFQNKVLFGIVFFLTLSFILPVNAEIESPRQQMNKGTSPENVLCKNGLELVIRTNGSPACVKPETAEKMQKIGILFTPIKFTDLNNNNRSFQATEKEISTVPASSMSIVNFYITDHDLNIAHSGVEVIPTEGLFEFTVNGIFQLKALKI